MENQQWPAKCQQSATAENNNDSLNNGNNGEEQINTSTEETNKSELVKYTISEKAKQTIRVFLEQIKTFSDLEKYVLQLRLWDAFNSVDPLKQPLNPLGSRSEIYRTISWIKTHLEEDPDISLPKQQVYDEYYKYCAKIKIKALSQADFGKVMKQVYPKVRARRLGTRGNSRYCYSGLRESITVKQPLLPDLADKPMSTEMLCTQSNLAAAAWLIVKEWSEKHFGVQFSSLQTLACYLVINHSVGIGSEAASKLTTISESQLKGEDQLKTGVKHREMQIQLQRKIQQKNEVKERKRKIQSPKCEQQKSGSNSNKRTKSVTQNTTIAIQQTATSPITGDSTSTSTSTSGSTCTSPTTQGKSIICDKSLDFTQLSALPDFKSFQKPTNNNNTNGDQINSHNNNNNNNNNVINNNNNSSSSSSSNCGKVAIPRLLQNVKLSPKKLKSVATATATTAVKYKAIQPKLQQTCDITSNNPLNNNNMADVRSQGVLQHNIDKFKEKKIIDNDENDDCDFTLSRERLDSVSSVDKDAMDEYLGTNNSQNEEELSQYFKNSDHEPIDKDNTTKLTQLRQLLQQNGIPAENNKTQTIILDEQNTILPENMKLSITQINAVPTIVQQQAVDHLIVSTQQVMNNPVKRRVSFETPIQDEIATTSISTVPPSPNTRRKNFSFCPISPGPHSPNGTTTIVSGRQSKCSSANVSPRDTPVTRNKNITHQNVGFILPIQRKITTNATSKLLIKKESELTLDLNECKTYNLAMSAPNSPMLSTTANKSVLQKLLNSNSKVSYKPDYSTTTKIKLEVGDFIDSDSDNFSRSQSVPLNQMLKSPILNQHHHHYLAPTSDFNDLDPIQETESVNQIINALDETEIYNLNQTTNNCLPTFDLIINNNLTGEQMAYEQNSQPCPVRNLNRSHSIDVNMCFANDHTTTTITALKCNANPSRSVPNTPLPFQQQQKSVMKNFHASLSRSYPSTPSLIVESAFNYNNTINGDCLLNGQPIRTNGVIRQQQTNNTELADYFMTNLNTDDNNLSQDEFIVNNRPLSENFSAIVETDENTTALMDENCVLITNNEHQNYTDIH